MDTNNQLPVISHQSKRSNSIKAERYIGKQADHSLAVKGSFEIGTRLSNNFKYHPIYRKSIKQVELSLILKSEKVVEQSIRLTRNLDSNDNTNEDSENEKRSLSPLRNKNNLVKINFPNIKNNRGVTYGLTIGKGNNSKLVKRILLLRESFVDFDQNGSVVENVVKNYIGNNSKINIIWDSCKHKTRFCKLAKELDSRISRYMVYNHFEFNYEITQKFFLYNNMMSRYGDKIHKYLPLTYTVNFESPKFLDQLSEFLVQFSQIYIHNSSTEDSILGIEDCALKIDRFSKNQLFRINSRKTNIKIQSFEKFVLKIENMLFNTLYKDVDVKKKNSFSLYNRYISGNSKPPTTFLSTFDANRNMWLIKPDDLNRGNGVEVFSKPNEFFDKLQKYIDGVPINVYGLGLANISLKEIGERSITVFKPQKFVIQKYMEKPLLINHRKFDIRIHCLIDHNNDIYLSKEGYIRTSSENFTLDANSHFVHLTNNAVQKHNDNYCKFEDGNILPLSNLKVT